MSHELPTVEVLHDSMSSMSYNILAPGDVSLLVVVFLHPVLSPTSAASSNLSVSQAVPGWAALLLFILVLFLLGVMEGLQVCASSSGLETKSVSTVLVVSHRMPALLPPYQIALVELKRQDPGTYQDSHQRAYRQACTPTWQSEKQTPPGI